MTTGIYSGISAADLGHEPDAPVATCPKCDGAIMRRNNPPRGLVCISCGMVYGGMADIDEATLYYESLMWDGYDQRDEDASGYADTVAEGLTRWTR